MTLRGVALGALVLAMTAAGCVGPGEALPQGTCAPDLALQTDQDARTVTLTWTEVPGATTMLVFRSLDGGPEALLAELDATATTHTDTAVPPGVASYRVSADGPPPDDCPFVDVHIHGAEPIPPAVRCVPIRAEAQADGIVLSWVTMPDETYDVLRATGSGPLLPHQFVGSSTGYADGTVEAGVSYRYAVVANGLHPPEAPCPATTVTAVPFFEGVGLVAALVGAPALFALARWRRRS